MERRTPEIGLLESHVMQGPNGEPVFVGMSVEAARLALSHVSAWFRFRQARRIGSSDVMQTAELRAEAVRGPLVARLRDEGFGGEEIDALLDRHRHDDSGDPKRDGEAGTKKGYEISLGTRHPRLKFRG